jgi:DNA-binding transcriptional MerR regulator
MPNGYRRYPNEAQLVLELIDTAQKAGFSLDEIRTLLPASLEKWDHTALVTTLRGKLAEIVALEKRLAESKAQLQTLLRDIESKPEDMTCADNAQRVLSRMLLGQRDASEAPDLPQISGRTG